MCKATTLLALIGLVSCSSTLIAEEYVTENGQTYRIARTKIRRPVSEIREDVRHETVYRDTYTTEIHEHQRMVYMPITEYQWEPRWHGIWNPLTKPSMAYHLVPRTRWEARAETVRTPVTSRQTVPELRTVRTPVRTLRMVEEEQVSRIAVNPRAVAPATIVANGTPTDSRFSARITRGGETVARREPVGGISRMESDPPRGGATGEEVLIRR